MRQVRSIRWSTALVIAGAIGCSAPAASSPAGTGERAGPPTIAAPAPTTAAPLIASDPPPPSVPSTPPSTIATTVATTSAPTTTIDPIIEFQRHVDEYFEWFNGCLTAPTDCRVESFLPAGSDLSAAIQTIVDELTGEGFYHRLVDSSRWTAEKVLKLGPDLTSVTVCFVNADARMDSLGTPDTADDVIVDDLTYSFRLEYMFQRSGSVWRPISAVLLNRYSNEAQCLPVA